MSLIDDTDAVKEVEKHVEEGAHPTAEVEFERGGARKTTVLQLPAGTPPQHGSSTGKMQDKPHICILCKMLQREREREREFSSLAIQILLEAALTAKTMPDRLLQPKIGWLNFS